MYIELNAPANVHFPSLSFGLPSLFFPFLNAGLCGKRFSPGGLLDASALGFGGSVAGSWEPGKPSLLELWRKKRKRKRKRKSGEE